jgi:hypothetical protein
MVLAAGLWWTEQLNEARAIHEAIAGTARAARIPAASVYSLGNRAAIALDKQDEESADSLVREAMQVMYEAALDDHPWGSMAHIVHGTLLGRRGDERAAATEIEHGLLLCERLQAWQLIAYGSLALAEVRQRQHEVPAARRLLARVRDILEALPDPETVGGISSRRRRPSVCELGAIATRRPPHTRNSRSGRSRSSACCLDDCPSAKSRPSSTSRSIRSARIRA